jgi:acyl-coenzyme A synthetase/AMP-(fatty) acid ligase
MFVAIAQQSCNEAIFSDTAVLLSTSGTTGSPKLIRLSYSNLQANAEAITQYLGITSDETPVTSLPLSYSYGLSVVNSHLLAGSNLLCTNASLMTKDFWEQFTKHRCSSFAGVPFSYAMLERLRFEQMTLLRTITQAGGRLAPEKIRLFADIAKRKDFRFFVMYGQTEATARISYVPSERLCDKIGSIGIPIPGGHLALQQNGQVITAPHQEGELVYTGPNVMLGYAESRASLALGDEQQGTLYTGDLGHRDADGYFYVTGRLKRFVKIFGLRLNLDEVEKMLESALGRPVACVGTDDVLHVTVESPSDHDVQEARTRVTSLYKLHYSAVDVRRIESLPVTTSGKKDYHAIRSQLS